VQDGYLFVRFRMAGATVAGAETKRVALRRVNGRFSVRKAFDRRDGCGVIASFKLSRPVFGGRTRRALGAAFRLGRAGRATVELLRGGRVVRTVAARDYAAHRTYRFTFGAAGLRAGDYGVRLRVAGGPTATLTSRRL
jgi:hypothetical protein